MTRLETTTKTFGKATKRMIAKTVKGAKTFKAVGRDYLIKDADRVTVATWHYRPSKTGLLVISDNTPGFTAKELKEAITDQFGEPSF